MAGLKLSGVRKAYGATTVLHGIDLDVADGEFVVFVGPSGCGKSTLLRSIAGLETITGGTIAIDGADVTGLPASERGLAMVFQSYALYPHMSVYANMAFALENMGFKRDEIEKRVKRAATMLRLTDYLERKPKALSGGQRQRVAIGRAIVREPAAFLFDEPLSNLDAALRVGMRPPSPQPAGSWCAALSRAWGFGPLSTGWPCAWGCGGRWPTTARVWIFTWPARSRRWNSS